MLGSTFGAHAEYIKIKADASVVNVEDKSLSDKIVTGLLGGTTALYFLRDLGDIKEGQAVLINGASGSVGSAAVQIAKYYGADITAVCSNNNKVLVMKLGSDHYIDYSKVEAKNFGKYDIVLDCVGNMRPVMRKKLLNKGGVFLSLVCGLGDMIRVNTDLSRDKEYRIKTGGAKESKEIINKVIKLIQNKNFDPIISKEYQLEDIIEAHQYIDTGHKIGNVLIRIK